MQAERTELFVRLLASHQEELFRYVFSLHPHHEDARDVLQETSVALLRKFDEYDPAKPFLAWAYGFAYLEVLKQRDRNQRGVRLLSHALIERLVQERSQHESHLIERLHALDLCLTKLPPGDSALLHERYHGQADSEGLARQLGASRRTMFRELDRIRRVLLECMQRQLEMESN